MYEHVKTGCKHIPPSEQPLQFQSGYFLNKPRMYTQVWPSDESFTNYVALLWVEVFQSCTKSFIVSILSAVLYSDTKFNF